GGSGGAWGPHPDHRSLGVGRRELEGVPDLRIGPAARHRNHAHVARSAVSATATVSTISAKPACVGVTRKAGTAAAPQVRSAKRAVRAGATGIRTRVGRAWKPTESQ